MLALFSFNATALVKATLPRFSERIELGTFVSDSNEDLVSFLKKIVPLVSDFTKRTQKEACGAIAFNENNNKYSIIIFSDQVSIGCAVYSSDTLPGFRYIEESIHSHPTDSRLPITDAERRWSEMFGHGSNTLLKVKSNVVANSQPYFFSEQDFEANAKWLIYNYQLKVNENGKTITIK